MKLILGAGATEREPGAVHLDMAALPGIDVVHNLDTLPWPFADSSFDFIQAHDIIEHVEKVVPFIEECHRIGTPGALLEIRTVLWDKENSYTDPTHRHWFNRNSFDFFVPGTFWCEKYYWYSKCRMECLYAKQEGIAELLFRFRIIKGAA